MPFGDRITSEDIKLETTIQKKKKGNTTLFKTILLSNSITLANHLIRDTQ